MEQLEKCKELEQNLRDEGAKACRSAIEKIEKQYEAKLDIGETVKVTTLTKRGDTLIIEFSHPLNLDEESKYVMQIKRKDDMDNLHLIHEFGALSGTIRVRGITIGVNTLNGAKKPELFMKGNKEQELSKAIEEMNGYIKDINDGLDFANPKTTIENLVSQKFGVASHIATRLDDIFK